MTWRGIIFDLDGVICLTDQYHYQAWKELAGREDIYFDETVNNRLRGISRMDSLKIILERAGKSYTEGEKASLAEWKNRRYRELLGKMTEEDLPEEVRETLDGLRTKGYKLAVGSSSKNAKFILSRIGLADYFDAVSDGTDIARSKPDPEVFLKAAGRLGLEPSECLVVEDALAGIEAAAAGGFGSAGIGEAAGHPQVTCPLKSIRDLLRML